MMSLDKLRDTGQVAGVGFNPHGDSFDTAFASQLFLRFSDQCHKPASGPYHAVGTCERVAPHQVNDKVHVTCNRSKILGTVIDEYVRPQRKDEIAVAPGGRGINLRFGIACELHGECADRTGCAVYQHTLPLPQPAMTVKRLPGGLRYIGRSCSIHIGELHRFDDQLRRGSLDIFGIGSAVSTAEHHIARLKALCSVADRLDRSGEIHPRYPGESRSQGTSGPSGSPFPIYLVHGSRMYLHQYAPDSRGRFRCAFIKQFIGQSGAVHHNRFHNLGY